MASNAKATLIRRISGTPGKGTGANAGLGTTDVIVPEFPQLPSRLTEETIRQFREEMDRWRAGLQAQFPVPQATATATATPATSTDVSEQIKTALAEAIASINNQIDSALSSVNSKISQIEASITNTNSNGSLTEGDVRQIIRDSHYIYSQGVPSAVWTITHNLGWHPQVAVVDSMGNLVNGDVVYTSENELRVTFYSPFSGKAYLT